MFARHYFLSAFFASLSVSSYLPTRLHSKLYKQGIHHKLTKKKTPKSKKVNIEEILPITENHSLALSYLLIPYHFEFHFVLLYSNPIAFATALIYYRPSICESINLSIYIFHLFYVSFSITFCFWSIVYSMLWLCMEHHSIHVFFFTFLCFNFSPIANKLYLRFGFLFAVLFFRSLAILLVTRFFSGGRSMSYGIRQLEKILGPVHVSY